MDWVMGVTLNPRFFGLDMKFFWLRPSMMGWVMINLGVAAQQVLRGWRGPPSDAKYSTRHSAPSPTL